MPLKRKKIGDERRAKTRQNEFTLPAWPEGSAERIAAVLRERKKIGEERRRERASDLRDAERPQARYEAQRIRRRTQEINEMVDAVISSKAADEALAAHEMMEAS